MRLVCLAILLTVQVAEAQDKPGCKDSPLISRFPGSVITSCQDKADDSFDFSMPGAGSKKVEGEFHRLEYRSLRPRATLSWRAIWAPLCGPPGTR